jgi:hypothetical protein
MSFTLRIKPSLFDFTTTLPVLSWVRESSEVLSSWAGSREKLRKKNGQLFAQEHS